MFPSDFKVKNHIVFHKTQREETKRIYFLGTRVAHPALLKSPGWYVGYVGATLLEVVGM